MVEMERNYITAEYFRAIQMGRMPDGKAMYTLDGAWVCRAAPGMPAGWHWSGNGMWAGTGGMWGLAGVVARMEKIYMGVPRCC